MADDSVGDCSSHTSSTPLTRRRLLGTGAGGALALGIGAGVPQKGRASGGVTPDDSDSESESDTVGGLYAVATDTDGSSEDSRVTLGTLGHHHEWAETSPSELHFDEAAAGTQRWRFDTGDPTSSPTVVDGTVFVSSGHSVYAVDAETAEKQWRFATERTVNASPHVVSGIVFFGSADDHVYALDAETGDELWRVETGGAVDASPTARGGCVFVGSNDNNVYALDTETGDEQWRFETSSSVTWSSPTIVDGAVFIGGGDNTLYALDAEMGDELWQFEPGSEPVNNIPPATVSGGSVYVGSGSPDDYVYALDAETGDELWRFDAESTVNSTPTVADGTVYVVSSQQLFAIGRDSGEELWSSPFRASSPTVVGNSVFVGDKDGYVCSLERATGEEQWRFDIGESVREPTVVDGTLFVGSLYSDPETQPDPDPEPEPSGGHSEPEPVPEPDPESESTGTSEPEDQSGFGMVTTLTALGGLGYLVKRGMAEDDRQIE